MKQETLRRLEECGDSLNMKELAHVMGLTFANAHRHAEHMGGKGLKGRETVVPIDAVREYLTNVVEYRKGVGGYGWFRKEIE